MTMNKATAKEPKNLHFSMKAPEDYKNTLDKNQASRMKRRKMLEDSINKQYKSEIDPTLDE